MISISWLPPLNAALNGLSGILLICGLVMIKSGRQQIHKRFMISAFTVSCLFLVSYVTYHVQAGTTEYRGTGWTRGVYLSILFSHMALAATVPPLAIVTLSRALSGRFDRHRRIARVTFPIWLYVSVTGVIVYLMLRSSYVPIP